MNPSYRIFIDVCLTMPHHEDNIWLRLCKYIPYVPRNGDVIRFTEDAADEPLDITLSNVVYDVTEGYFLEEQTDDRLVEEHAASGVSITGPAVGYYATFGFVRLNFPTYNAR